MNLNNDSRNFDGTLIRPARSVTQLESATAHLASLVTRHSDLSLSSRDEPLSSRAGSVLV